MDKGKEIVEQMVQELTNATEHFTNQLKSVSERYKLIPYKDLIKMAIEVLQEVDLNEET